MSRTDFNTLLEAGAHFGHLKRKWNPKMAPYIFTSMFPAHPKYNGRNIPDETKADTRQDKWHGSPTYQTRVKHIAVSYTHLDVYKRQILKRTPKRKIAGRFQ